MAVNQKLPSRTGILVRALIILFVGGMVNSAAVFVNPLAQHYGWTTESVAGVITFMATMQTPGHILSGWMLGKVGAKKTLIIGCILLGAAFAVSGLVPANAPWLLYISATGDFDTAISIATDYLKQVQKERENAEEAIEIVKRILSGGIPENTHFFKRKEVSEYLGISMDALRNWEMNGLLTVKRRQNGYRVYTDEDIQRLKIIRCLRCANYSLEAILRMLRQLSENPNIDIKKALDTPKEDTDIMTVCDKLISSLLNAENNADEILLRLQKMKLIFS